SGADFFHDQIMRQRAANHGRIMTPGIVRPRNRSAVSSVFQEQLIMKIALKYAVGLMAAASLASAQSPAAETSAKVAGKSLTIKYFAPSVRGRDIFSPKGVISNDSTYPVWRAGANAATALHTDADLDVGGLNVPKGDYTL